LELKQGNCLKPRLKGGTAMDLTALKLPVL
jgi:hypothetical protein